MSTAHSFYLFAHHRIHPGYHHLTTCFHSSARIEHDLVRTTTLRYRFQTNDVPSSGKRKRTMGGGLFARCSFSKGPSSSEISSAAKIRSEVLSPFRTVRMFFYIAFIASGSVGGLIATTQLIAALTNPSRAVDVEYTLKGLAIDVAAVSLFAYLYWIELKAKNLQLARLTREETLANLKLCGDGKVVPVSALRGVARLVILAGPASFLSESFRLSEPYTDKLLERGVRVVTLTTDRAIFEIDVKEDEDPTFVQKKKRLWQLLPADTSEWAKWLDEQKKLANVSRDSSVYISLRMDGRVRGSGVGYPPWNAFVAQLPPVKGIWSNLLDGMDGRV